MFKVFLVKDELNGRYVEPKLVSQHRSLAQALKAARSYKGRATVCMGEYTHVYGDTFMDAYGNTVRVK